VTQPANLELVERIRSVRFSPVRLREGYDMAEVDRLLDAVGDSAARGVAPGPEVTAARFSRTRFREGYDVSEVDAFLVELAASPPEVAPTSTDS
jgi:DivIVA domain-containing protein